MITLQKFTSTDFPRLISWVDSEAMLVQFAGPTFQYPLTDEQLFAYLEDPRRHPFTVLHDNRVIGHAEIKLLNNNTARLCRILIGEAEDRGKGLGEQIIRALVDLCWSTFQVKEIELNVYDWNTGAIRCYEKVGFTKRDLKITGDTPDDTLPNIINMILQR